MSSGVLADMVEDAAYPRGIDSVMIVRNGYVVLDAVFYPFPEDTRHQTHSATKSFTGTLVGMALDRGMLDGLDVPVVDVLPDAAPAEIDERKARSTVEHFLTMTHGLDCMDSYKYLWRGYFEMAESDDWPAHVLALPMRHEPGTYFEYCNGASVVLSAIVSEVTGQTAAEFAEDVLFGPLGITDFEWVTVPPGISNGEDSLYLRPHDMAKFGYLYLRGGEWDGAQLLPQDWVAAATAEHAPPTGPIGYGYQWWILEDGYQAAGLGGQLIRVIPNHDLVVVFTAGMYDDAKLYRLVDEYVIPAVVSDRPLPPDPDGEERLAAAVAAAAAGPEPKDIVSGDFARFDGVRFRMRDNDEGLEWVETEVHGDVAWHTRVDLEGAHRYPIGLDGRYRVDNATSVAMRGAWLRDDTFVIEWYIIGEAFRGTEQWVFEADTMTVRSRNSVIRESATFVADRVG